MADKREDVKARFWVEGVCIAEWARAHSFNPRTVYRVLSGELEGRRGETHRIAVALGLKEEPENPRFSKEVAA